MEGLAKRPKTAAEGGRGMCSLWEALGRPPLDVLLPSARASGWRAMRLALGASLRAAGEARRVRTPTALCRALRGNDPPPPWAHKDNFGLLTLFRRGAGEFENGILFYE